MFLKSGPKVFWFLLKYDLRAKKKVCYFKKISWAFERRLSAVCCYDNENENKPCVGSYEYLTENYYHRFLQYCKKAFNNDRLGYFFDKWKKKKITCHTCGLIIYIRYVIIKSNHKCTRIILMYFNNCVVIFSANLRMTYCCKKSIFQNVRLNIPAMLNVRNLKLLHARVSKANRNFKQNTCCQSTFNYIITDNVNWNSWGRERYIHILFVVLYINNIYLRRFV